MTKYNKDIIEKTAKYIEKISHKESGHDWSHIERVWKNAIYIWEKENANLFIVELAALLHEIWDHKFNNWVDKWWELSRKFLEGLDVDEEVISHITHIIETMWFKWTWKTKPKTLEWLVVQDADRLEAIWAITIWRAFAYWWKIWRAMYIPEDKPWIYENFDEYLKSKTPESDHTIKHFYEKLLLLKDLINTETAKKVAIKRHKFMEDFLKQFFIEWNGEDLK